jgi:tetratricopeptide (TPR) repeat protein
MARSRLLFAWVLVLAPLAIAPAARAGEKDITVYRKGATIRFDADAGAELKEVILETYDCGAGTLTKKESLETYYHLSENGEIITPDKICDACYRVFKIEKKADKYFFEGIREKPATAEEVAAARAAAPPATSAEAASALGDKVRKIAQEIQKMDSSKSGPEQAKERTRIINGAFTTQLDGFGKDDLAKIAGFVTSDRQLSKEDQYLVLRAFGWAFYEKKDVAKAVFFYDRCADLIPDNYSAYFQRGVAQAEAGLTDDAIQSYAKAISLRPQKSIAGYFERVVKDKTSTAKLDPKAMLELKAKLQAVDLALQGKDAEKVRADTQALSDAVAKWYAAPRDASSEPGTPPPGGN